METVWEPLIVTATFSPNPATTGQTVTLSVLALDVFGDEQTEARLSGEFVSGEV